MYKCVVTSGYFNPIHRGHLLLLKAAKALGDHLVVIVNNDKQVQLKGSIPFMDEEERLDIVSAIQYVDNAILSIDEDKTVRKTLEKAFRLGDSTIKFIFAKGGDRTLDNIPEKEVCERLGIEMVFGVGGTEKINSSSEILKRIKRIKEC